MGGPGDPTAFKPNKAIETWAKYKEDYHIRFRFTPRRVFDIGLWGLAVPFGLLYCLKQNFIGTEVQSGRDRKSEDFLGP